MTAFLTSSAKDNHCTDKDLLALIMKLNNENFCDLQWDIGLTCNAFAGKLFTDKRFNKHTINRGTVVDMRKLIVGHKKGEPFVVARISDLVRVRTGVQSITRDNDDWMLGAYLTQFGYKELEQIAYTDLTYGVKLVNYLMEYEGIVFVATDNNVTELISNTECYSLGSDANFIYCRELTLIRKYLNAKTYPSQSDNLSPYSLTEKEMVSAKWSLPVGHEIVLLTTFKYDEPIKVKDSKGKVLLTKSVIPIQVDTIYKTVIIPSLNMDQERIPFNNIDDLIDSLESETGIYRLVSELSNYSSYELFSINNTKLHRLISQDDLVNLRFLPKNFIKEGAITCVK